MEDFDLKKLYEIQEKLAKDVKLRDTLELDKIKDIAGCDLAYSGERVHCAVVVLKYPSMDLIKENVIETSVRFPYIPTLLAFREVDPIIRAINGIDFDVLLIDGQGIAHPRGLGIASHIGVLLDKPTIGVAKSRLCGDLRSDPVLDLPSPLIYEGREVGYALITKKGTRPIFISPGHKVSLHSSLVIVKRCIRRHKLPEPSRLAHLKAASAKRPSKAS